ncbi:MAG TPA: PQQ-binding-like beta-propeller repeat protein [Candidatus Baltobacteraceae bacterium]|jgi:outer membrane protein assembly factor BamB|nr:PQQ-binding-like beta-propeller repeat protein [Candidatus Baltobacteraceae bacterium]
MQTKNVLLTGFSLYLTSALLTAADWPQWRGPNRDDVSSEQGLLKQWPPGGPPLVWKARGAGAGYSGVAVSGTKVFTLGEKGDSSFAVAFDVAGGSPVWTAKIGKAGGDPAGPRSTPTVDGDRVYVLNQFGDLVCLEVATGKKVWRRSFEKEFGGRCGGWMYSESPLVDGDRLIGTPGSAQGSIAAFNKKTGELLWQTKELTDAAEYSSPIAAQIGGVRQYIQLTGENVVGVQAESGQVLWRARRQGETATVPTPIFYDDDVYVSSGYGVGCNLFHIGKAGNSYQANQVYANKVMVNHHGGVVRVGDYLYGYSDGKGWVCQEFRTGRLVWRDEGVGKGSLTCADGHLYLRSEGGHGAIALVEATPQGYTEASRFDQPDRSQESSWPHPVIAGGRLYLRDQDVLLCYNVRMN